MSTGLRRILAPGLATLLFGAAALLMPDLMPASGGGAAGRLQDLLFYAVQIGLWISGALLLSRVADLALSRRLGGAGRAVPRLVANLTTILVYILASAGVVGIVFHQSVAGIWATSGALSIVLGLALRGIILDIFTGIAIHLDRSYRIGDWVEVLDRGNGQTVYGKVVDIDWRTTRLESDDKRTFLIPNSRMGMTAIANYSLPTDVVRFEIPFTLDFSVDPQRAIRVMLAGAKAACGQRGLVETPEPSVVVAETTALGIEYRVRYWHAVSQLPLKVGRHLVAQSVLRHLERAGLTLAYPKQDTFHARLPARQLEHHAVSDRARLLAHVEALSSLAAEEREQLARAMIPRLVAAGAVLAEEGEPGESMFVLAEGLVEVSTERAGSRLTLAKLQPGACAGEMSLLTGEPRSARLAAVTEVLVYEVIREHLMPILAARPALFEAISELVARRRSHTGERLAAAAAPQEAAESRVAQAQILGRMRLFFRAIGQRHTA